VQVFGWIVTEGTGIVSGPLDGSNGTPGVASRAVTSSSS